MVLRALGEGEGVVAAAGKNCEAAAGKTSEAASGEGVLREAEEQQERWTIA